MMEDDEATLMNDEKLEKPMPNKNDEYDKDDENYE